MTKQLRTVRHRALITVLAAARHEAGLTQRDLAALLHRAHSFVGKIESGERQLNVLEFCEYANALGINAPDLLRRVLAGR
jgi:transcriptional regulator with XRE-family HTH domain